MDISFLYIVTGFIGLLALMVSIFLYSQSKKSVGDKNNDQSLVLLQNQLQELNRTLDNKIGELNRQVTDSNRHIHDSLQQQFGDSSKIIRDVYSQLTKLDETNKQVFNVTDQLKDLQDILKNPKQRGVLGEYYLETLLKNVLPPGSFQMQYKFKDGEIVDAVVFVKEKIIPVDSKFSLENYNRIIEEKNQTEKVKLEKAFVNDLKERIKETAKYIRPEEGTLDFAFMFIPHEAIYYDLLINKIGAIAEDTENLIQRAAGKYKVIIVSPTSFLAYLQTVLQGLKALRIEESAKEIRNRVGELSKHIGSYEEYLSKVGNSLTTTVNHYNNAYKEFKKIDKDVVRISDQGGSVNPLVIEKPQMEE